MAFSDPEESTVIIPVLRGALADEKTLTRLPAVQGLRTPIAASKKRSIKVPEITALFWVIKLLSTALGESFSDFMVHHLDPVIAVLIGAAGFSAAILLQFGVSSYNPVVYWLAVVMVAIFGTMAADVVHIVLKVSYLHSSEGFAIALAFILVVWYFSEKTLSVHSINTFRREIFYWSTVIATFALGTALGDLTATTLKMGYFTAGLLFIGLFLLPVIGYFLLGLNEITAFWAAYILTRPIGASFADWTGRMPYEGGIGVGTGKMSIALAVLIALLVGYAVRRRRLTAKTV